MMLQLLFKSLLNSAVQALPDASLMEIDSLTLFCQPLLLYSYDFNNITQLTAHAQHNRKETSQSS
jgi:hypothetical protein